MFVEPRPRLRLRLVLPLLVAAIFLSLVYKVHRTEEYRAKLYDIISKTAQYAHDTGDSVAESFAGLSLAHGVEEEESGDEGLRLGLPEDTDDDILFGLPGHDEDGFPSEEKELLDAYKNEEFPYPNHGNDYRVLLSETTRNKKYSPVYWNADSAYNANLIPHPTEKDMWIVVAQHEPYRDHELEQFEELVCLAGFWKDVLTCWDPPTVLPMARSVWGQCADEVGYTNMRPGPRDARVFNGPDGPYIVYGSQSQYTCLGIWVQDLRALLGNYSITQPKGLPFSEATEIRRPEPWSDFEKNFFLFWDDENNMYAHYDLFPDRSFAKIEHDGSAGDDLASEASPKDATCREKYMPELNGTPHQATNSLQITTCRRADPSCKVTNDNTFIMHIFQDKTFDDFHGMYEPYVVLFRRTAPFELYAIAQRPFWYHGRERLTEDTDAVRFVLEPHLERPADHTEMLYTTSINWKNPGQNYHGYADDPLFIGFGLEDCRSGAIDVLAGDLLQDLGFCD